MGFAPVLDSGVTPQEWSRTLASPPVLSTETVGATRLTVRRFVDFPPRMEQPPLCDHLIALHLGGSKRVTRRNDGRTVQSEVVLGNITIIPALRANTWTTEGPIDFAHLYLSVESLDRMLLQEFDRDPRSVELVANVGIRDPLIEQAYLAPLGEAQAPGTAGRLFVDGLLNVITHQLLRHHSTLAGAVRPRFTMAPFRLRRVTEYVESHLAEDIALTDLARVAELSPYHFIHAFHRATGLSPCRYLTFRRIECAKALIHSTGLPLVEIAARCGFRRYDRFAAAFGRLVGTPPGRYRRQT